MDQKFGRSLPGLGLAFSGFTMPFLEVDFSLGVMIKRCTSVE
jgi:hypothetical protein